MLIGRLRALWHTIPASEKRITLSTIFTFMRIALTPAIVFARISGSWVIAFALFVLAAMTDFIDGWLARVRNEETLLGAVLDPLADKILIVACFAVFSLQDETALAVPIWFVVTILLKEIMLCIGALCVYVHTGYVEIRPTLLGKATTAVQLLVIAWFFACHFFVWIPLRTCTLVIGLLFCLVGATLIQYGRIGMRLWYGDEYV